MLYGLFFIEMQFANFYHSACMKIDSHFTIFKMFEIGEMY